MTRHPPNETPSMPMGGRRRLKRIEAHTDEELDVAVRLAVSHCKLHELNFWLILHGVDAYMQRRGRRDARRTAEMHPQIMSEISADEAWGDD